MIDIRHILLANIIERVRGTNLRKKNHGRGNT